MVGSQVTGAEQTNEPDNSSGQNDNIAGIGFHHLHDEDGKIEVEISRDKMAAYLTITAPKGNGRPVTRQLVETALMESNIVFGLIDDVIDQAISVCGTAVLIAKGNLAQNGEDGSIIFKYRSSTVAGRPSELTDGRIDYYNLDLIQCVEPGDVLATKQDPSQGSPGCTVTGKAVPAIPGKDINIISGSNTELSEDGRSVRATIPGHVVIEGNKISVSPIYEVNGDVDFNTGNISFNGSVVVKGSVCEGFRVVADGNVEITKTISGGLVQCGGDIRVKNGIVGRNKSEIKASGSLVTRFIENGQVECGGDVVVSEAIMHSKVSAAGTVTVEGKGVIVGGIIRAGEEIKCKIAGSNLATATELEAGVNPQLRSQYNFLFKEKQTKDADYLKGHQALKYIKKLKETKGELSSEQLEILVRVNDSQIRLGKELEELAIVLKQTESLLENSNRGRITVYGLVHPGVKITIGRAFTIARDDYQYVTFVQAGGEIQFSSCR